MAVVIAPLTSITPTAAAAPGEAPGAPGASANWTTGDKQGLGTSVGVDSKVWYTLANGALSEVYYPTGDTANVRELEFAVTDGTSFVDRESDDTTHTVELADSHSLTYRQVNTAKSGRYRITKTYVTDPGRHAMVMSVTFQPLKPGSYRLYTLYDPAIGNSSLHDTATRTGTGRNASLLTSDGNIASALVASSGFTRTSNGFVGTSDGWTDLAGDYRLDGDYDSATDGNVLQTGEIPLNSTPGNATKFTLALGFGDSTSTAQATARASLASSFTVLAARYQSGWHDYLNSLLKTPRALTGRLATQYNVSVMTVKAHEDKTNRGAFIASLTLPWGFAANADQGGDGYHKVWARDEYQQVSSLLAAGDRAAARRAVTWLFTRQQLADGTFPQTSKVDGTPVDHAIQLDQTAFPIILAWQIGRTDDRTWAGVRAAANALVAHGPTTPQERWEETGGYSNSTLPAMIAGLVAASDIARQRGDRSTATLWLGVADQWQRSVEKWLFTTTGPYGNHRYYIRIDDNGNPNDESERDFGNAAGVHLDKAVVDGGFLDLVRLGVKAPNDPYVAESLPETDASLAVSTPSGKVWHRYTFDGYGEQADGSPWALNTPGTKGRAWPLLGGERGEYEVANGRSGLPFLKTMANTANDGYMIPEQVWDQPEPAPAPYGYPSGKATGSASPLAWAMAQYVRLARAIDAGRPVETPAVVAKRYASGAHREVPALTLTSPADGTVADQTQATVRGTTDARRIYVSVGGDVQAVTPRRGTFAVTVPLALGGNKITVVAQGRGGGTNMRQLTVVSYGTRVGAFTDPSGDDNGPGTYVYPTASVYRPGIFDLTGLSVYTAGDDTLFVSTIRGDVTNDFGGQGISHQRFNVYLGDGTGAAAPALPGTNMNTASRWTHAIVGDGRYDTAGVYLPDGTRSAAGRILAVPEAHQIAVVVPTSSLAGVDLTSARYGIAMFGDAEAGEGIGNVRPVYDLAYWQNPGPDLWWITQYRFGGGAGVWNDSPSHDSDTRDPNAIDIIVGPGQAQADVMNWQAISPVALPMMPLVP